jgi:DNA-binding beta-propeller fold protein YncE
MAMIIAASVSSFTASLSHGDLLVADRLTNSVYRYGDDGSFKNVVVSNTIIKEPTSIAVSADGTQFYVTTSNGTTNKVVRYDYDSGKGTAGNETVFASLGGFSFPSSVVISPDGNRVFVSDLNAMGISQYNLDGSSAGPTLGAGTSLAGLAFAPSGELLAAEFADQFFQGSIRKSDGTFTTLGSFIDSTGALAGASSLIVHGNDLYATGMFASSLLKYNIDPVTGIPTLDTTFGNGGAVDNLPFPQGLALSADKQSLLVGILGVANGQGRVDQYSFDGDLMGTFLTPGGPGGLEEATAIAYVKAVPEPGSILLFTLAGTSFAAAARRRKMRGKKNADSSAA